MKERHPLITLLATAFLITGSLVGAGILGLPIEAGIPGFFPSVLMILIFGSGMYFTSLVLAQENLETRSENFNFPSLYSLHLGNFGKWTAIVVHLFILYGLLIAYLVGATAIIADLLHITHHLNWVLFILFCILTLLSATGVKLASEYNTPLVILLCLIFVAVIFISVKNVHFIRLTHTHWIFTPVVAPIIVTSFFFQNLIPDVTKNLSWKKSHVFTAISIGMIICALMNILWTGIGIGDLPFAHNINSLVHAYQHQLPANIPMAHVLHSTVFTVLTALFALLAIVTSFIAQSVSLMSFNRDLMEHHFKISSKLFCAALTFAPPLIISLINPNIFMSALNVTGGIGIIILFGVLPCALAIIKKSLSRPFKIAGWIFLILFLIVLLFEIASVVGLIHISFASLSHA